jgi:gliding motility-associated-like protein
VITINANPPSADYEYLLNFGFWQKSNVFENLKPGLNTISVRNSDACEIISKTIFVADFKRFFTPNGDSFNDFWKIEGDEALDKTETFIFDRYGRLIYQHQKASQGWDGTFNGVSLPADDYWFKIIYTNKGENHEFKGNFSLKR